jgi:hypothetical protein
MVFCPTVRFDFPAYLPISSPHDRTVFSVILFIQSSDLQLMPEFSSSHRGEDIQASPSGSEKVHQFSKNVFSAKIAGMGIFRRIVRAILCI